MPPGGYSILIKNQRFHKNHCPHHFHWRNSMQNIYVVPPSTNLLEVLASDLVRRGHESSSTVIFPHRRPAVYLKYYLTKILNRPFISPTIRSFEDWTVEVFVNLKEDPEPALSEYDQAWIIYEVAKEVFKDTTIVSSWDDFFPWALKIVNLFKEFDLELTSPQNLFNPPQEKVGERAAKLLEKIGKLYESFNLRLQQEGYTTSGKRIRFLAESDTSLPDGPIYLVGFYALTNAEDRIFKRLYEQGAYIYWHADKDNLPELYKRWKKEWNVELKEISGKKERPSEIFFFEAHDLHSELKELKQRLPQNINDQRPDSCAIALLSPSSLIPLLHHLPDVPVNLTMGYPLNLTGIYIFLKSLFSLVTNKDNTRGYHTRDLIEFLKGPYISDQVYIDMSKVEFLAPFLKKEDVLDIFRGNFRYLEELFKNIIEPVDEAYTTYKLSQALKRVFSFLDPDKSFTPFEKEFLKTIFENVLPILEDSLFCNVAMGKRGLFRFFEHLISSIRIPFEGEPLVGLQIMGPLETRLLSFDEISFLDVNEGIMPSVEEVNPLVPHGIREAVGLPTRDREEAILRYHFERFLQAAKKVHIFWQYSTTSGDSGLDNKKLKSRYVEKLIWDIEQKEKKLLSSNDKCKNNDRFKKSSIEISLNGVSPSEFIEKHHVFKEKIKQRIKIVSPSLIEEYIRCPLSFFYREIIGLKTSKIPEEVDYGEIGTAVHTTLQRFIEQIANMSFPVTIEKENLKINDLIKIFEQELENRDFFKTFSPERKYLLLRGAKYRFLKYIENQPDSTTVLSLEKEFVLDFDIPELNNIKLKGRVDRIDERDDINIILDYKTGWIKHIDYKKALEIDVEKWIEENQYDVENLKQIFNVLSNIQLPFYIYLFVKNTENASWNKTTAAYINLRKDGAEKYFIEPKDLTKSSNVESYTNWMKKNFPELIKYIILHMLNSPYLYPAMDKSSCNYCEFKLMCRYSV